MKKISKLLLSLGCLCGALSFTSCSQENKVLRIAVPKTVDGMNLYLTGVANSHISSSYVFLGDMRKGVDADGGYGTQVIGKMSKSKPDCDIAYVESEYLDKFFTLASKNNIGISVIFIDSINDKDDDHKISDADEIKGVWIARNTWIEEHSGKNGSMLSNLEKALVRSAAYRTTPLEHTKKDGTVVKDEFTPSDYKMRFNEWKEDGDLDIREKNTFVDVYNDMKAYNPDYNFSRFNNIYQYCAAYEIQNTIGRPDAPVFVGEEKEIFENNAPIKDAKTFLSNEEFYTTFVSTKTDLPSKDEFDKMSKADKEALYKECIEKEPEVGKELINKLKTSKGLKDDQFNLEALKTKVIDHHYDGGKDAPKSKKMDTKTLVVTIIFGIILVSFIAYLIYKRIKTGKSVISIKRALDVDIVLDDDEKERLDAIPKNLIALREKKGLDIKTAAKTLHITQTHLKLVEQGDIDISKRLKKNLMELYNIPASFFVYRNKDIKK